MTIGIDFRMMKNKVSFPRPFAIAIDDLGWINGSNDGEDGYGPYRLGINRKMQVTDYEAVVSMAQKLGVRLQGLFIMGEMDRENFLGQFPKATHMRKHWDNSENISDLQLEIMEYVKSQAAHLEFGLHGVGHEFWPEPGKRNRAEWYNTDDHCPWPEEDIRNHTDCFVRILDQYDINAQNGHSFPESFVPCAYSYYWNPEGNYSLGSVLSGYGVKYANTDFSQIPECNPPKEDCGNGFDHGVHVINRYNYGNLWYELGKVPTTSPTHLKTDFIETHWPNLLAQDYFLQESITNQWLKYYRQVERDTDRYIAKNTAQVHAQSLFKKYTVLSMKSEGCLEIDNTSMPDEAMKLSVLGNLVLKVRLNGQHVSSARLDNRTIPAYIEDGDYGYIYLPTLERAKHKLLLDFGEMIDNVVWHDTTANIYNLHISEQEIKVDLRLYGTQTISILCAKKPHKVKVNNECIKVLQINSDEEKIAIKLSAQDIQGETGTLTVSFS